MEIDIIFPLIEHLRKWNPLAWSFICLKVFIHEFNFYNRQRTVQVIYFFWVSVFQGIGSFQLGYLTYKNSICSIYLLPINV